MALPTYTLSDTVHNLHGQPLAGITVMLSLVDRAGRPAVDFFIGAQPGAQVPIVETTRTADDGTWSVALPSNLDGSQDTRYRVQMFDGAGRELYADALLVQMPQADAELHDLVSAATATSNRPTITLSGDATGSGQLTGAADVGIIVELVAAQVLAKLLGVDGAGSALDADLLDAQHGSYYLDPGNFTAGPLASGVTIPEAQISDLRDYLLRTERGAANGVASLDAGGLIPSSQLPQVAITTIQVAADAAERDGLTVQSGDVVKQLDTGQTWMWDGVDTFIEMTVDPVVDSVAGMTGDVVLSTDNVSEAGNLYYTAARANAAIDARVTKAFVDALDADADTLDGQEGAYYLAPENMATGVIPAGVSAAGPFGIGIANAQGTLHVVTQAVTGAAFNSAYDDFIVEGAAGVGMTIMTDDDARSRIGFGSPSDSVGALVDWEHESDSMRLGTSKVGAHLALHSGNFDEALRIDSGGNLLLGTTSGTFSNGTNLEVSSAQNAARIVLNQTGTGREFYIGSTAAGRLAFFDQTAGAERVSITDAGAFGIGTTGPDELFEAEGTDAKVRVDGTLSADATTTAVQIEGNSGAQVRTSELGVTKASAGVNPAGYLRLESETGTPYYLWVDTTGDLRISATFTDIATTSGTVVGAQT